ncbi:MAG: serine/threonine protein phosphatase PrpC [Candidatus Nanohaloarchaea archaeon]|jgi:serine/threonine protein phosphatase PrpC
MPKNPEIRYVAEAGSPGENEDYLWIGPESGFKAVLVLDGTSGTEGDFGATEELTGGQRYVEFFGEEVQKVLEENPDTDLEKVLKSVIGRVWDRFEDEAEKNAREYLSGGDTTLQRAETVPAAVGSMVRWDEEKVELIHVGDVETYIKRRQDLELHSNDIHGKFDQLRDDYIEKYGRESEEVKNIVSRHRSAHNLPGTYPNMSFNPLVVEKLGKKESYSREEVERVVMSTDGGTVRMKRLFGIDEPGVMEFLKEKGVEKALDELRQEENREDIDALKKSDDAAVVDIRFGE